MGFSKLLVPFHCRDCAYQSGGGGWRFCLDVDERCRLVVGEELLLLLLLEVVLMRLGKVLLLLDESSAHLGDEGVSRS